MMICDNATFRKKLAHCDALILGCESATALGIIRCLGAKGVTCAGVAFSPRPTEACFSRYADVWLADPDPETLLDCLNVTRDQPGIIFCATDDAIVMVDEYIHALQPNWRASTAGPNHLRKLMDKKQMAQTAKMAGFDVPATLLFEQHNSFDEQTLSTLSYPVIVKPADSLLGGKELFHIIHEPTELSSTMHELLNRCSRVIVQEYISASDADVWEAFALRDPNSNTSHVITMKKIRQYPDGIGSSSFIHTCPWPELSALAHTFLNEVHFDGIADFEVIRRGAKAWFIEVNYRSGTPIALCAHAGMNLPWMAFQLARGETLAPTTFAENCYYLRDNSDWRHIREGRLSLWQFLRDIRRADVFLLAKRGDMGPFWFYLKKYFKIHSTRRSIPSKNERYGIIQ